MHTTMPLCSGKVRCGVFTFALNRGTGVTLRGNQPVEHVAVDREDSFQKLRDRLVTHFTYRRARNQVYWLKTAAECRPKGV